MNLNAKQVVIVINAIGSHITSISPNPPAAKDEMKKYGKRELLSSILWWYTPSFWFWMQLPGLLEIIAISCDGSSAPYCASFRNTFNVDSRLHNITITPSFTAGTCLVLAGTTLRILCYRALGRNFTFQLAIKKDHKLITHGPYALVRHPSYTAFIIFLIGLITCQFGEGSLWAECDLWGIVYGQIIGVMWLVYAISLTVFFILRTKEEDKALKAVFGEKWEAWAATTKYRLFPGLY